MRDEDKLRERYELLLDNRQIFLLFLASAVILALVFSLGVVVGKRLDDTDAGSQKPTDPLALLDQVNERQRQQEERGDEDLVFHEALTEDAPVPEPPAKKAPAPGPQAARSARSSASRPPQPEARAKTAPEKPAAAAGKTKEVQTEQAAAREAGGAEGSGKYTLQLSSFQDRHEAEQFLEDLRGSGLEPYVVKAEIPGRGLWYRVRMGRYETWDKALEAKKAFEREQDTIAYVAKR